LSGYSASSFLRRVDFPVPEGPKRTRGWVDVCAYTQMNRSAYKAQRKEEREEEEGKVEN